jgi:mannose-6-phosphate isomerase-like protein (cupin superfamily)
MASDVSKLGQRMGNGKGEILVVRSPIIRQMDFIDFMDIKNLNEVTPFTTKDGSEIRELLAHRNSGIRKQSLAEARLPAGGSTQEHYHVKTEEIYYITHGTGRMRIEGEMREVKVGDAIAILPGQKHKLWNTGKETLRLLCCCAPAYEHEDTIITEV